MLHTDPVPGHAVSPARQPRFEDLMTRNLSREHGFEALDVEGNLPEGLRGTLYRNGPGIFDLFGARYDHPFEGDGAVNAVRFDGRGGARGAVRITESAGLRAERQAGRRLFGSSLPWWRRMWNMHVGGGTKNTANTNVIVWQERVLALMEAARPTELDADDLRTLGETDLGVVGQAFSAHPHYVHSRRALYNFGVRYGRESALELYELPDRGAPRRLGEVPLDGPPMLHDFIATDHHLVFFVPPAWVDVPRMMLQRGTFTDMFRWRPERGVQVVVVPIDRPDDYVSFHADAFYQWHYVNAFERDRDIVVDFVHYPDFSSFRAFSSDEDIPPGTLHRATVDTAARRLRLEQLDDRPGEFPRVHPGREGAAYNVAWLTVDDLRGIARYDLTSRTLDVLELPQDWITSEVVFVPTSDESEVEGWLIGQTYDASRDRSGVSVYDAARFIDGPVATAWFDHPLPITFHGNWAQARQASNPATGPTSR